MKTLRRSRDLAIALGALVVAIGCAVALSIGIAMRHNQLAAGLPYQRLRNGSRDDGHRTTRDGGDDDGSRHDGTWTLSGDPVMLRTCVTGHRCRRNPHRYARHDGSRRHDGGAGGDDGFQRHDRAGPNRLSSAPMGMIGMMRIVINPATVPPGQVSFRVTNAGALNHELVILPLAKGQYPGQRAIGPDGKVDEAGSLVKPHAPAVLTKVTRTPPTPPASPQGGPAGGPR